MRTPPAPGSSPASGGFALKRARLRRLAPDRELLKRRAAGEPLRLLAADYHVAHTTLSRWFARPEIGRQLRATDAQHRQDRRQARL